MTSNSALVLLNTRIWLIYLLFTQGAMYTLKEMQLKKGKACRLETQKHAMLTVKVNI